MQRALYQYVVVARDDRTLGRTGGPNSGQHETDSTRYSTHLLQHRLLVPVLHKYAPSPRGTSSLLCFSVRIRQLLLNDDFYAGKNIRRQRSPDQSLVSFQKTWTTLLAGGIPFHVAGTNEKTMATLKGEDK